MRTVSIRELRNQGGDVVDRVAAGETIMVTRDGVPVAEMHPVRAPLNAAALLSRWRAVPMVDADELRANIDEVLEPGL